MEPQVLEGQLLVMQEILRGDRSKKGTGSQGDESAAAEEAEGSRSQSGGPELKDAEGSLRSERGLIRYWRTWQVLGWILGVTYA